MTAVDTVGHPLAVVVVGHGVRVLVALGVVGAEVAKRQGSLGAIVIHLQPASRVGRLSAHLAEDLLTTKGTHIRRKGMSNRWVLSNVLGDACRLAGSVGELIAVDTCRLWRLGVVAGSAGKVK